MNTSPYEAARLAGRREMRDDASQTLARILAITEDKTARDAIWDAIEQIRDLV